MSKLFATIKDKGEVRKNIKDVFGLDLDISGSWGHDEQSAVCVHSFEKSKEEFFTLFASLRANIELNVLKPPNEQYGGINPSIKSIEKVGDYIKVTFLIEAMPKATYNELINEYKEGYGNGWNVKDRGVSMEKNQIKLAIGGMLQDIGKIIYRTSDGRNHSEIDYDYLKNEIKIKDNDALE